MATEEKWENLNILWASLIVHELVRNGVDYFCISPGSRSTPLTVAAARHPAIHKKIFYDERGAAYHALGYARATGKPAVLISTSGTAVANYLPAVVEASRDLVPMLLLTADRPPELRHTAANQTIYQPHIFGDYVRWFFDIPAADEQIPPEMLLTTVNQAVYRARRSPAGPVHLNLMFREPLEPTVQEISPEYRTAAAALVEGEAPFTRYSLPRVEMPSNTVTELRQMLLRTHKGLLVVGKLSAPEEEAAALQLAQWLGWPLIADATSGLRLTSSSLLLTHFDRMLASPEFQRLAAPEMVLHLGGRLTSKRYWQWIHSQPPAEYVVLKNHPYRFDPVHRVRWHLEADIPVAVEQLITREPSAISESWRQTLQEWNREVTREIEDLLGEFPLSEPDIARILSQLIPEEQGLFLASSLPIREVDMFAVAEKKRVRIAANRGASGIDGLLSSAAGFACGLQQPVTLLIGDLAFMHDMNALTAIARQEVPLIIILINNHGGGIFHFLPISAHKEVFDPYFTTPHEWHFQEVARQFDIPYQRIRSKREFLQRLHHTYRHPHTVIFEIETTGEQTYRIHQQLDERIRKLFQEGLKAGAGDGTE